MTDDPTEAASAAGLPARPRRKARTVYVDDVLWERLRAAVGHMRYFDVPGEPDTLAGLVESAIELRLTQLEATYGPFRPVKGDLKTGPGSQGRARLAEPRRRATG